MARAPLVPANVRALVAQSAKSVFCAMTGGPFRYRLPPKKPSRRGKLMLRKIGIALAAGALASTGAVAQDTAKIGLVLPLTGGLAPVGKQVQAGAKLYMDKHGATVAGKKI